MNDAYPQMTARQIAEGVGAGTFTAGAVLEIALARIAALNPTLNAVTEVTADRARRKAAEIDAARDSGATLGPLAGVPFGVKNLGDIQGVVTIAGSKINRDRAAAQNDATVVTRLEAAGAILTGALNMGEFAYDFTGENAHDGPARNPHDTTRMTGGSSGGSGGAVAGGLLPLTVGSDTNGSIRVPSAWCGIYGLKPTYGRVPRTGTFPFVDSLDHIGPMGRNPVDLAAAFTVMQGHDSGDPACCDMPARDVTSHLSKGHEGLRIAVADGYFAPGEGPASRAVAHCADALGVTDRVTLSGAEAARAAAYVITCVEGAALHADTMATRLGDYGEAMRERLLAGAMVPGAAYVKAQRLRRAFAAEMGRLFDRVDVILAPATPMPAPQIGQETLVLDGREQPFRPHIGIYTQPISFIGLPVVTVPVHGRDTMPMGVQIIAPPWREDLALRVAQSLADSGATAAPIANGVAA